MSEAANPVDQLKEQAADATQKKFTDPYEFLGKIQGAPSKATIEAWKVQTPNNRVRVFTPDAGKRVYLVRAVSGMELQKFQAQIPENMDQQKAEREIQFLVGAACVLWTNQTASQKLTPEDLRNGSAGLPVTLFQLVSWLSDFVDPEAFTVLSAEL